MASEILKPQSENLVSKEAILNAKNYLLKTSVKSGLNL